MLADASHPLTLTQTDVSAWSHGPLHLKYCMPTHRTKAGHNSSHLREPLGRGYYRVLPLGTISCGISPARGLQHGAPRRSSSNVLLARAGVSPPGIASQYSFSFRLRSPRLLQCSQSAASTGRTLVPQAQIREWASQPTDTPVS